MLITIHRVQKAAVASVEMVLQHGFDVVERVGAVEIISGINRLSQKWGQKTPRYFTGASE